MTRNRPIDLPLLGSERPLLQKLAAHLVEYDRGKLDVTLCVPLDISNASEKAAVERFAPEDHILDVRYIAEINLAAERASLSHKFSETYRTHAVRRYLTKAELEPIPDDVLRDAFVPIAVQGHSVFQRLCVPRSKPDKLLSHGSDDWPVVSRALESAFARPQRVVIKSPLSLFPWAMLYDDPRIYRNDYSTFDVHRFWGFRHVLQEVVPGAAMAVRLPRVPQVVAAVCPKADPDAEHRRGRLGDLQSITWVESSEVLRQLLADFDADCLYFFGHAEQENPPTPATSVLRLDGVALAVNDITDIKGPQFKKGLVLAFLNGCETRPIHEWDASSIAGLLCTKGECRVCAVTTFAEIPVAFGRRFGQIFWERFLSGDHIGTAIRDARIALLEEYANPLGLLYSLIGRAETRLG